MGYPARAYDAPRSPHSDNKHLPAALAAAVSTARATTHSTVRTSKRSVAPQLPAGKPAVNPISPLNRNTPPARPNEPNNALESYT